MHILIIHNDYGVYSGEEVVVDKQKALFQSMGHEVSEFRRSSSGLRNTFSGNLKGFINGFYSQSAIRDIKHIIQSRKPDVSVIHNLYPFISPAILKHLKGAGIPIIMTVHNYRLICPTGLFLRNDGPCENCLHGSEWNCIKYNCEHSLPKSIAYASRNWYARKTRAYHNNVDIYACLTQFQIQKLTQAGYDKSKMTVIPNFVEVKNDYTFHPGKYVAVSGRLSKEKGIELILKAAKNTPHITYMFAGSKRSDEMWQESIPDNCVFLGHLTPDEMRNFYSECKFLLSASVCYEGFPMTLLEAASYGKPAIGPAHAGFLEIIDNKITGMYFAPGNATDMETKITKLWSDDSGCELMGKNAFGKLQRAYSTETVKIQWQQLFEKFKTLK